MCRSAKFRAARRCAALLVLFALLAGWATPLSARAEMIRDLVTIVNVFPLRLEGFGIVTGLRGRGDKAKGALKAVRDYMERMGLPVNEGDLATGNIALVRVEADLSPWATAGQLISARVSATNGATDLANGNLLAAELYAGHGRDRQFYAIAKGKLIVGKDDPVNASLPANQNGGAQVIRPNPQRPVDANGRLALALNLPNAADAVAIAQAINMADFNPNRVDVRGFNRLPETKPIAFALDPGKVEVWIPGAFRQRETEFIDALFRQPVDLDRPPRIVVNQAKGSLLVVGDVRVERPGVGAIKGKTVTLAPPPPPADPNSREYLLPDGAPRNAVELAGHNTEIELRRLVDTLNAMGLEGDDLGYLFRQLKEQGALRAELIVE